MSFTVEQRDINTVKGYISLALNDLEYSRYRSIPEDKKTEAYWRAYRTLQELLVKIQKFESAALDYDIMMEKLENFKGE